MSYVLLAATCALFLVEPTSGEGQLNTVARHVSGPERSRKKLLFSEHFHTLDTLKWRVEMEVQSPHGVYANHSKLVLDTKGGVTVWLKQPLRGNLQIDYTRKVLVAGGPNDRLSDVNQFWMAQEPTGPTLDRRSGKFEDYDQLPLYYVGMGGNTNTTTRFRKYQRTGERTLLQEYTDAAHLLVANKEYRLSTIVQNGTTSFWVNGQCYFTYHDPAPLPEGYFGFRATSSRQEIADFRVYQLE
jgi:rhamnogalacturonan endolyase